LLETYLLVRRIWVAGRLAVRPQLGDYYHKIATDGALSRAAPNLKCLSGWGSVSHLTAPAGIPTKFPGGYYH
jgi:hypothetical protein